MRTLTPTMLALAPGFDGLDSLSPKPEIRAEIARVEALQPETDEDRAAMAAALESLNNLLAQATEAGGYKTSRR